jgi:hypothetical protein
MEPQHPANPPDDWPGHSTAKYANAPITPSLKDPPESEVQAFENNSLAWQGQDAVPVHSQDEDILDHEVRHILKKLERLRIQLKACRVMPVLTHDRILILRSEELGALRELVD